MKKRLHIALAVAIAAALFIGVLMGQTILDTSSAYAQQIFQNIISGKLTVINDSDLRGSATVGGDLTVTGGLTSGGVSVAGGVVTIASETFVYDTLGVTTTLNVTGDATIGDLVTAADLNVTEQITTDDITVADLATVADLSVTEQLTTASSASVGTDLSVLDDANVAGDLLVGTYLRFTPQAVITVTNDSVITPTGGLQYLTSAATRGTRLVVTTTVPAGTIQIFRVATGSSGVTLTDTAPLCLVGNAVLTAGDTLGLLHNGVCWEQLFKNDNG